MLQKIREVVARPRQFRLALAKVTPLIYGRETRKLANAIGYNWGKAEQLASGAVPFEPRDTYPARALEWARGQ